MKLSFRIKHDSSTPIETIKRGTVELGSFDFGTTVLGSTFETATVLSSCHYRAKFILVRHGSITTFGTGLNLQSVVLTNCTETLLAKIISDVVISKVYFGVSFSDKKFRHFAETDLQ